MGSVSRLQGQVAQQMGSVARLQGQVAQQKGSVARLQGQVAQQMGSVARLQGHVARHMTKRKILLADPNYGAVSQTQSLKLKEHFGRGFESRLKIKEAIP